MSAKKTQKLRTSAFFASLAPVLCFYSSPSSISSSVDSAVFSDTSIGSLAPARPCPCPSGFVQYLAPV
eukprot:1157583-Pelagomonas_calceolata.AAC.9